MNAISGVSEAALRLSVFRAAAGLSQAQAAAQVGVGQSTVCGLEAGTFRAGRRVARSIERWTDGFISAPHWDEPADDSDARRGLLMRDLVRSAQYSAALRVAAGTDSTTGDAA